MRENFKRDFPKWKFLEFKNLSSTNFEKDPWNLVVILDANKLNYRKLSRDIDVLSFILTLTG